MIYQISFECKSIRADVGPQYLKNCGGIARGLLQFKWNQLDASALNESINSARNYSAAGAKIGEWWVLTIVKPSSRNFNGSVSSRAEIRVRSAALFIQIQIFVLGPLWKTFKLADFSRKHQRNQFHCHLLRSIDFQQMALNNSI